MSLMRNETTESIINDTDLALGALGFVKEAHCLYTRFDREGAVLTINTFEAVRGACGPVRITNHASGVEFTATLAETLEGLTP